MAETAAKVIVRTQGIDRGAFDADEDRQLVLLHLLRMIPKG